MIVLNHAQTFLFIQTYPYIELKEMKTVCFQNYNVQLLYLNKLIVIILTVNIHALTTAGASK